MINKMFRVLTFALLPAALVLVGCRPKGAAETPPAPAAAGANSAIAAAEPSSLPSSVQEKLSSLGFQVPRGPAAAVDFELEDLQGRRTALSGYRGKVVFLNFWATWCPPCRKEMPAMQELYRSLGGTDFEIVAVDLQEEKAEVQRFVKENGLTFPVLLDTTGQAGTTYSVRNIPTTYLIDRKGNLIARLIGGAEWNSPELLALFKELLRL